MIANVFVKRTASQTVDGNNLSCSELVLIAPICLAVRVMNRVPLPNPTVQGWVCSFGGGRRMQDFFSSVGG